MKLNEPDDNHNCAYPELCQTDQATLRCALAHLSEKPDPKIVGQFSPFVSLEAGAINDLMHRIQNTEGAVSVPETNVQRRPVFTLVSQLVSDAPLALGTVVLPRDYEPRVMRVAVHVTESETVRQTVFETVTQRLEDYDLELPAPDESELDLIAVEAASDHWGSRLSLLWKDDSQLQIPESVNYNNVVNVVPVTIGEESLLQKVVTFICPDQRLARYVVPANEDCEAVSKAVSVASDRYPGVRYSWLDSAVYVDTVVQSDGSAFVVRVS